MKSLFLLHILFFFTHTFSLAQEEWTLRKETNHTKVFTRSVEGFSIKEFKATTTINASAQAIIAILSDHNNAHQWLDQCEHTQELQNNAQGSSMVYYVLTLPWPFDKRDMVLKSSYEKLSDTKYKLSLQSSSSAKEKTDGCIRIENARGFWIIEEISPKKCAIQYQFLADPAGNIPSWAVNLFIVDGPINSINALKKLVE